jgi:hypothetical protein
MHHAFMWLLPLVTKGFFVLFWCLTLAAFLSRSRAVKHLYLACFFSALLAAGLGGEGFLLWPFHNWNLWPRVLPREKEYFEIWLEDERGRQIIYDPRAVAPMNTAFLNLMHGPRMWAQGERNERSIVAEWLLERSNVFTPQSSLSSRLQFPVKDLSFYEGRGLYENVHVTPAWPADHGAFVALIVRKKHAAFGPPPGAQTRFTLAGEHRFP